jgi:hypothetical protein
MKHKNKSLQKKQASKVFFGPGGFAVVINAEQKHQYNDGMNTKSGGKAGKDFFASLIHG